MHKNETTIDENAIATRAYELFLARGGEHGHADEDWVRAEQELRGTIERLMDQAAAPAAPAKAPAAPAKAPAAPAKAKKTTAAKTSRKTTK